MAAKVKLIIEKRPAFDIECGRPHQPLTMALPFFRSAAGWHWHRVRSGIIHYDLREWEDHKRKVYSHTSIKYWCGNGGFLGEQIKRGAGRGKIGTLSADPGEGAIHCAVCEGKAAGMGLDGARKILGRTVLYSPRL